MKKLLLASAAVAVLAPAAANAEVVWLCKPGAKPNPCRESQKTTVQNTDGTTKVVNPKNPARPKVDCFYVYPTVSGQQSTNADKSKDPELLAIARYQAARFSLACREFAPVYRQLTLSSIYTGSAEERAAGRKIAYADVREAWLEYLTKHNRGRGFVLIGHSQGAGMLRLLVREQIDAKPALRKRLISGLLLGGNVVVRKGKLAGGDFQHVPGCSKPAQTGCVIAYSIFDEDPPTTPATRFGKVPETDTSGAGLPAGPDYEVLCTNPGSLGANRATTFTSELRTEPFPGSLGAALMIMYGGPPPTADTPWLQPKDRYKGQCATRNDANVLLVEPVGDSRDLNPSPTPDWGLHLADVNMPLVQLVNDVRRQSKAWLAARRPAKH